VTWSQLVSDDSIASSARYRSVLGNIVSKRGKKVEINVPLYLDDYADEDRLGNSIFMDSTLFGATGCSLQVTMQARNLEEACLLHDGLIALGPVMLALTAGTPVFRGLLADSDTRWTCFEQAVDDRTEQEIADKRPARSRVSASTTYCAPASTFNPQYQLTDLDLKEEICKQLEAEGMHANLARHFAYLLSRDPLYASREAVEKNDASDSSVCDGLLANIYQIVRLKQPPDDQTGWRVEFRPMESQLTDFENAAFCVFVILAARVILECKLDLYVPLQDIEESMQNACRHDAVIKEDFVFRGTSIRKTESKPRMLPATGIINGITDLPPGEGWEGMAPLIRRYINQQTNLDSEQKAQLLKYIQFVSERADGDAKTLAWRIRDFIACHPEYKRDSVVSEEITYDLIKACIENGLVEYSGLS
jgi:glutamate--cysteine ligase catalytic subunit